MMPASNSVAALVRRVPLDRPFVLFMAASVGVFALLGVNEVTNDEWGMVRTLGQYQAVLIAILVASIVAQEFERGTILWGLTQRLSRVSWFAWRLAIPCVAVVLGSTGLGLVLAAVHTQMPRVWLDYLTEGALLSLQWQTPVGAGLLGFGIGALVGIMTRRVIPAVSLAGAGMVAANLGWDTIRDALMTPGQNLTSAAWAALGIQAAATAGLVIVAARLLKRLDI